MTEIVVYKPLCIFCVLHIIFCIKQQTRKTIRLPGYNYSQNGLYFVTICTQNRESLFGNIVGANHDSPICIWQRNYYEHIIRNESEYLKIKKYIKQNPMMWERDRNNPENIS